MHLTRRHFLMSSAGAVLARPSFAQSSGKPQVLKASVADVQLLPEGYGQTSIWGYEGSTPGPEIRVAKGASIQRTLLNEVQIRRRCIGMESGSTTQWTGYLA